MKELTDFLDKYDVKYKVVGDSVVAEEVDLANREITQLPNSIGNLNCKCIDLRNNKITSLPSSFGNLKREYLYLDNNLTLSYIEIFYPNFKRDKINYCVSHAKEIELAGSKMLVASWEASC